MVARPDMWRSTSRPPRRRDDAGRMPCRIPQAGARTRRGGALHHPRPRRPRADRPPHHGAETRQESRVRPSRQILQDPQEEYRAASSPSASRRTASSPRRMSKSRRARRQQRDCLLSRQAQRDRQCHARCAARRHRRGGWRVRLGQVDARSRRHRPPAARRGRGLVRLRRAAAARPTQSRSLRRVQMIYQMPDVALNPTIRCWRRSSARSNSTSNVRKLR